jgi:hypothetical protein
MTDAQICEAMRTLGIGSTDFSFEGPEDLDMLKARARRALRSLAKTHHPDRTADKRRHEVFRVAAHVVQDIESTEYVAPVARRRRKTRYSFSITRTP